MTFLRLRTSLAAGILVALAATFFLVSSGHAQKKQTRPQTVYVIVHGAWGGSWAFKKVDSLITAQGNLVYRPSLTGQGERVHLATTDVGLSTHIDDVVNMILFEDLHDIILIGHSYGGMVITGVADRVPDRIRRLIYLDALLPVDGENVMAMQPPGGDEWLKSMTKDGFIIPPWAKADQKPPKDVPQSLKTFTEPIALKNGPAKIPGTYILTVDPGKKPEDDTFFSSSKRAKERGYNVMTMSADHNPQWSAPKELVALLLKDK